MSEITFVKRNLAYWRDTVRPRTDASERAVLADIHDLLMSSPNGRVSADVKALAKRMLLSPRLVARVLPLLIEKGLLSVHGDMIGSEHMDELRESKTVKKAIVRTSKREETRPSKPPIHSDLTQGELGVNSEFTGSELGVDQEYTPDSNAKKSMISRADPGYIREERKEKKDTPLPPKGDSPSSQGKSSPLEALRAFEAWNAMALRCGLPQASKLTPIRMRSIGARLKDYGPDGWTQALANIEKSSFLTGNNDRGFRADLDWICKPDKFSKIHDGGYGNGRHAAADRTSSDRERERLQACRQMAEDFVRSGVWNFPDICSPPGKSGCWVSPELLAEVRASLDVNHNGMH